MNAESLGVDLEDPALGNGTFAVNHINCREIPVAQEIDLAVWRLACVEIK